MIFEVASGRKSTQNKQKPIKNQYVFRHQIYQQSNNIRLKLKSRKAYPKKHPKSGLFGHFGFPQPSQNPSEIDHKSMNNPSKFDAENEIPKIDGKRRQEAPKVPPERLAPTNAQAQGPSKSKLLSAFIPLRGLRKNSSEQQSCPLPYFNSTLP